MAENHRHRYARPELRHPAEGARAFVHGGTEIREKRERERRATQARMNLFGLVPRLEALALQGRTVKIVDQPTTVIQKPGKGERPPVTAVVAAVPKTRGYTYIRLLEVYQTPNPEGNPTIRVTTHPAFSDSFAPVTNDPYPPASVLTAVEQYVIKIQEAMDRFGSVSAIYTQRALQSWLSGK